MTGHEEGLLSVLGLSKNYPEFRLKDITFELGKGKITGFIGRNGAGKTTTINSILSFVRRDGGEVLFRGMPMTEETQEARAKIGFVSAGMTYYTRKKLKVITDVTKTFYPEWEEGTYRQYMQKFGLSEEKTPEELSNGMKIKYALALALSHGAELFILDEPTSGLDPISREELVEVFLQLKDAGKTVLFSTHITSDLEKCADRILFIRGGALQADAELEDFRKSYRIAEIQGALPAEIRAAARGCCRVKDGMTALIPTEASGRFATREATLEEIMIHLEKEGEEA